MDPFDSIKSRLDSILPENHRWLLLGLTGFLFIVTHDNDYTGAPLLPRNLPAELAITTTESLPPITPVSGALETGASDLSGEVAREEVARELAELPENLTALAISADPTSNSELVPDFVTEVKSGDNLTLLFSRAGLTPRDVYEVSQSKPQTSILNSLYPGYNLEFYLDDANELESLTVVKSRMEEFEFSRDEQGRFISEHRVREPEVRQVFRDATIDDSLFLAAQRGGMSAGVTMELAGIFGGVIDFLLDTRQGDTFNLMYEEKYLDGEYIGYGRILAAQFTNQGETFTAVRYVNNSGIADFYNPDGESMRKAFLRNPVDFTRISDGFNPRRRHPILNTIRAHKGTDYAAPRGTPVVAAGDGRVTWSARNGSFGKLVVIQHGEKFQTKYAHLNDYAKGVKKGARVRQGQVIGYVGSTGGATGPHLHYEFLMDGVHRNSRTIHDKLPKAESVPGSEMQRFKEHTQILLSQLEGYTSNTKNIAQYLPASSD